MPKLSNMPELIDKKAMLEVLCFGCTKDREGICRNENGRCAEYTIIKLMPTIKPEVRHGRWIPVTNGRDGHECDQCRNYAPSYQTGKEHLSDYCPMCGAKMIGGN